MRVTDSADCAHATDARLGCFSGRPPTGGTHPECPCADVTPCPVFPTLIPDFMHDRISLLPVLNPPALFLLTFPLRMAPHRAILVHDILLEILEHLSSSLSTTSGDSTDRTALLSAALTCKRFLDPALSVLWRNIDDFLPLLVLFSSFQAIPLQDFERRSSYSYHATSYVSYHFIGLVMRGNQGAANQDCSRLRVSDVIDQSPVAAIHLHGAMLCSGCSASRVAELEVNHGSRMGLRCQPLHPEPNELLVLPLTVTFSF